jgi:putative ABC transport system ATP-binding protein
MMNKGEIVLEKAGVAKEATSVNDILHLFNEISIECGN